MRRRERISIDKRDKVTTFFRSDYIIVRNITRRVAETARDLVWDQGIAPKDSLHVATALDARVGLMNTFDRDLTAHSGSADLGGLEIRPPSYGEPRLPGL